MPISRSPIPFVRSPLPFVFLALVVLIPLSAAALEEAAAPNVPDPAAALPAAADSVFRFYDISSLRDEYSQGFEDGESFFLVPFAFPSEFFDLVETECVPEPDEIVDVLYQIIGGEYFDTDENAIGYAEGKLFVKGPEAIHETTAMVLDFLDRRLNRRIDLSVDVFAVQNLSCLDDLEVDTIDAAAGKGSLLPVVRRTLSVRPGELAVLDSRSSTPLVIDYDPEIAQSSIIFAPIVKEIDTGLSLCVRPLLTADGSGVDLCVLAIRSDQNGSNKPRDPGFAGRIATVDRPHERHPGPALLDRLGIEFASTAAILPTTPGEPALLQTAFSHSDGIGSLVLRVSARAADVPDKLDLGGQTALCAIDCDHLMSGEVLSRRFSSETDVVTPWFVPWEEESEELLEMIAVLGSRGRATASSVDDIVDLLENENLIVDYRDDYDESVSFRIGNVYFHMVTPENRIDYASVLAGLYAKDRRTVDADIRFVEVSGPAVETDAAAILEGGRLIGRVSLPMAADSATMAVAGLEGIFIYNYDVEVANNSSCVDLQNAFFIDGLRATLEHELPVMPGRDGGTLRAGIRLNLLDGPIAARPLARPGAGGVLGWIDTPRFDHGVTDVRFAVDGKTRILDFLSITRKGKPRTIYIIGSAALR